MGLGETFLKGKWRTERDCRRTFSGLWSRYDDCLNSLCLFLMGQESRRSHPRTTGAAKRHHCSGTCNSTLPKCFHVGELAFGDICLLGSGRFAVQNSIAVRVSAERGNDLSDVAGLVDQR